MKKIILLLSATVFLISCSKDKYTVSGTTKGIENGNSVYLEMQDSTGNGFIAVDTVKISNGKFEIKGKAKEPSFHMLRVEGVNGMFPFILENGDIIIDIDKDSLNKSKLSGTYNNDELVKFNEDMIKVQKSLIDFQKKNTALMNTAQQNKDTAVINKLMKEFGEIQQKVQAESKTKYSSYSETHPKSFISVLILQGMANDPSVELAKIEKLYAGFDDSLKNTKPGKAVQTKIKELKNPKPAAGAAPMPAAPGTAK